MVVVTIIHPCSAYFSLFISQLVIRVGGGRVGGIREGVGDTLGGGGRGSRMNNRGITIGGALGVVRCI